MIKICSKCRARKNVDKFSRCASAKDGLNSHCKSCDSVRNRRYREENPDKERERRRRYYVTNREEVLAAKQRWREANPEKRREQTQRYRKKNSDRRRELERERSRRYREENPKATRAAAHRWEQANPAKVRERALRRRARLAVATMGDPTALQERIAKIYTEPCARCGAIDNIHVDHIWPLSKGGAHAAWNLQALCKACNSRKGAKLPLLLPVKAESTQGDTA